MDRESQESQQYSDASVSPDGPPIWVLLPLFVFAMAAMLYLSAAIAYAAGMLGSGLSADSVFYYGLQVVLFILVSVLFLRFAHHHKQPRLGLGLGWHGGALFEIVIGVVAGAGIVALFWGAGLALRWYEVASGASAGWHSLFATLVALALAAFVEELMFRGYALQLMLRVGPVWPGVLVSSVLFGLAHNANPGASWLSLINTSLAGVLLALLYVRTRSLILPTVFHFAWNAMLGIGLGLPVSGVLIQERAITSALTPKGQTAVLLSGGGYGPEAGLLLTLIASVFFLALLLISDRKVERFRPIWGEAARNQAEVSAIKVATEAAISDSTSSDVRPERLSTEKE